METVKFYQSLPNSLAGVDDGVSFQWVWMFLRRCMALMVLCMTHWMLWPVARAISVVLYPLRMSVTTAAWCGVRRDMLWMTSLGV